MSFRNTAILGSLLIILAGYFYYFEFEQDTQDEVERVFKTTLEDITRLGITIDDRKTVVEKIPLSGWQIVEPLQFPTDNTALGELLSEFVNLTSTRTVVDSATSISEYGLDPPAAVIEVSAGLTSPMVLYLGDANPTRSSYYALAKDTRRVFLVSNEINNKFRKETIDLRDRQLLHVNRDNVTRVKVQSSKNRLNLDSELDSLSTWRLVNQDQMPAETNEIINLISNISGFRGVLFVDDNPKSLRPYGLDRPVTTASIQSRDGTIDASLSFGNTNNTMVFVKSSERETVYGVPMERIDAIVKDPDVFRRTTAFDFKSYKVSKFGMQIGKENVSCLKRSFDDWRMMEPLQTRADDRIITSLLDSLEVMKIKQYIEATPGNLKRYGLDNPSVTIVCTIEDQSYPKTIQVGSVSDDGMVRYVRDSRENWIYAVSETGFQWLPSNMIALRDRKVMRFKGFEVNMMEITKEDHRLRVRRDQKQKTVWKLEEPFRGDADAVSVGRAFTALDSIYIEAFVSDEENVDLSRFGLDKPSMEVTLLVGGRSNMPEEKLSLIVGKPFPGDTNLIYVKRREYSEVSLVNINFVAKLNRLIANTSPTS